MNGPTVVSGACGVFMGLLWSCGGSLTRVELPGDSSTNDAYASDATNEDANSSSDANPNAGDATREDANSSSDVNPNEASIGDADTCHPKGCGLEGCSCTSSYECCSGRCLDRFCVGDEIDLFCGRLACFVQKEYCRITRGADSGGADSGAAYECVLMPDRCGTRFGSCECLRSYALCGGTTSFVSCKAVASSGETVTCE